MIKEILDAMLFLGIIIGVTAGFFFAWWFAKKGPPLEPFFLRFLGIEKRSARLDTRLMLHELHGKVGDLFHQVRRLDQEMQELQKVVFASCKREDSARGRDRGTEIQRLFKEGFSPDDIARQLRLGKGEVELVLSLDKKPSWVIDLNRKG